MNPPAGSQRIVPYLYYDDPRAALEHLCRVFGFEQTMLLEWPDGSLAHAELTAALAAISGQGSGLATA